MKIKTKLTINVVVVMIGIGAVTATSIVGMGFVKSKLVYLTERSTPFQIRSLEYQKAVQGATADIARVSAAANVAEYKTLRTATESKLLDVEKAEAALATLKGSKETDTGSGLKKTAEDIFKTTEGRLQAEEAAENANKAISAKLKGAAAKFKELDQRIKVLQQQRAAAYGKSMDESKDVFRRIKNIQMMKDAVKDLHLAFLELQKAQDSKRVIIGRGKANTALDKLAKADSVKDLKNLQANLKDLRDKIDEVAKIQTALLLPGSNESSKARQGTLLATINDKLAALSLSVDGEDLAADAKFDAEVAHQGTLFAQVNSSNMILIGNSELHNLGLSLETLSSRFFTASSVQDVGALEAELAKTFGRIDAVGKQLQSLMQKYDAKAELQVLRGVLGELNAIRGLLTSQNGIVASIRHNLEMKALAKQNNEKMQGLVVRTTEIGKVSADAARGEQEKAITTTNKMVNFSSRLIAIISFCAVSLGIAFGMWIFRSISRPLNGLLDLSKAIAQGDLTKNLEVKTHDELGEVVTALNAMVLGLKEMIAKIVATSGHVAAAAKDIHGNAEQLSTAAHSQFSATEETSSTMTQMATSINSVADNAGSLATTTEEASATVLEMSASSEQVSRSADIMAASVTETTTTIERMGVSIEKVAQNCDELASSVTETSTTIEQMTVSIEQVAGNSQDLRQVVESTSNIIETMADSIRQMASDVAEADSVAQEAAKEGVAGRQAVQEALVAMQRVAEASEKTAESIVTLGRRSQEIGNIVKVINEIADQTNLLALNAAIEAARAGDAGRGFAVVADEVRALAERSVAATRDIAQVIRQVQDDTIASVQQGELASREARASMQLSGVADNALTNIVKNIEQTSCLMSSLTDRASDQASHSTQVISAVRQMSTATEQVAHAAQEQAIGGRQIRVAVERMNSLTYQVADATREQAVGSKQIRVALDDINQMTRQVTIATREQAVSARQVVNAVNDMNAMTQSVANATSEQRKGGEMVVVAIGNISDITRTNLTSVEQLANSAQVLSQQAANMETMVTQFKVS
jgi:methyl-accepting chemotaxis protein